MCWWYCLHGVYPRHSHDHVVDGREVYHREVNDFRDFFRHRRELNRVERHWRYTGEPGQRFRRWYFTVLPVSTRILMTSRSLITRSITSGSQWGWSIPPVSSSSKVIASFSTSQGRDVAGQFALVSVSWQFCDPPMIMFTLRWLLSFSL